MEVVGDGLWLNLECMHEVGERLFKELEAGEVFKVAQVLALIGEIATGDGECVLEVASDGE